MLSDSQSSLTSHVYNAIIIKDSNNNSCSYFTLWNINVRKLADPVRSAIIFLKDEVARDLIDAIDVKQRWDQNKKRGQE